MPTFTNASLNTLPVPFTYLLFTWYSTNVTLDNSYAYLPLCLETECLSFQMHPEKAAGEKKKKHGKNWLEAPQEFETILFYLCFITVK